jgi:hypothetical protein
MPRDVKEYYDMQVVPLKKILQILVKNNQLVINKDFFRRSSRQIFNPCKMKSSRCLLYVAFKFKGRESSFVYEFDQPQFVIPHDIK